MRLVDLLLAFPGILLALAIIAILGGGLTNLMIAVGISVIPDYVRITRGTVLSLKQREFVLAARVIGCRGPAIMRRHILPNVMAPLIVWRRWVWLRRSSLVRPSAFWAWASSRPRRSGATCWPKVASSSSTRGGGVLPRRGDHADGARHQPARRRFARRARSAHAGLSRA